MLVILCKKPAFALPWDWPFFNRHSPEIILVLLQVQHSGVSADSSLIVAEPFMLLSCC